MADVPFTTLLVGGEDATEFLQGQLTNDIARLDGEDSLLAAWCNPKGRVICILHVRRGGDGYTLTLPDDMADDVVKRLTMFRFRSKVTFDVRAASADEAGVRTEDWRLERLQAGLADIRKPQSEQFTPHMLNLDLLDAISFDKGCYTGQEVVARTHYRGATKRRALRFESDSPVAVGQKVSDGERDVGEVVNVAGRELLAVVPVAAVDSGLRIDDTLLRNLPLPYSLVSAPE